MLNNILFIGIVFFVLVILIILFIILTKNNKNNDNEKEASILDINEEGVPNTSELKDFLYGYEKEETIVMDAVKENKNDNNEEKSEKDE